MPIRSRFCAWFYKSESWSLGSLHAEIMPHHNFNPPTASMNAMYLFNPHRATDGFDDRSGESGVLIRRKGSH